MKNKIHCFKDGQPCEKGLDRLKNQLEVLNDPEKNPFNVDMDEFEVDESTPPLLIVDEDSEEDIDIDI